MVQDCNDFYTEIGDLSKNVAQEAETQIDRRMSVSSNTFDADKPEKRSKRTKYVSQITKLARRRNASSF